MATTYVVQFDVESASGKSSNEVVRRIHEHLAEWASKQVGSPISAAQFDEAGGIEPTTSQVGRALVESVSWQLRGTPDVRALQFDLSLIPVAGDSRKLTCAVTTLHQSEGGGRTQFRISFEEVNDTFSPARPLDIYPPILLHRILSDRDLICRTSGQRVDAKYINITQPEQISTLRDTIERSDRLPLLLVGTRNSKAAEDFIRRAARQYAGLTQICTLRRGVSEAIPTLLSDWKVDFPVTGAVLMWPDTSAAPLIIPKIDYDTVHDSLRHLMRILAPLSVRVHATNDLLVTADKAASVKRRKDFAMRMTSLVEDNNVTATNQLLLGRVAELEADLREWEDFAGALTDDNAKLRASIASAEHAVQGKDDALRRQARDLDAQGETIVRLTMELAETQRRFFRTFTRVTLTKPGEIAGDLSELAPDLDALDLVPLAEFLEQSSDGAIVFTQNAIVSWSKCDFPYIDDMRESLVKLTMCAMELRADENFSTKGQQAQDWFKERGLNEATTGSGLKDLGIDTFAFEGKKHSQLPHIKVSDHDTAAHIGRIYFAFDPENNRLVVNHVGLKLYNGPEKTVRKARRNKGRAQPKRLVVPVEQHTNKP